MAPLECGPAHRVAVWVRDVLTDSLKAALVRGISGLLALLVLAAVAVSCADEDPTLTVLLVAPPSTVAEREQRLMAADKIIAAVGAEGGRLVVSTFDPGVAPTTVDFPSRDNTARWFAEDGAASEAAARRAVAQAMRAPAGEDSLEAIDAAAVIIRRYPERKARLVVMSSLLRLDGSDLAHASEDPAVTLALLDPARWPDLSGVSGYVYGVGAGLPAVRRKEVTRLWESYFRSTGMELTEIGPALVRFP